MTSRPRIHPAAVIIGVLAGELLLVSLWVDAYGVLGRRGAWAIAGHAGKALTLSLTVVTCVVLTGAFKPLWAALGQRSLRMRWLALQGATYLFFLGHTRVLFSSDLAAARPSALGLLPWAMELAVLALSAVLALAPLEVLLFSLRGHGEKLVRGTLLGVAVWGLALGSGALWPALSGLTLGVSSALLNLVEPEVVFDAQKALLGTPRFVVSVDAACSGIEGLGLMSGYVSLLLIGGWRELRWPRAFAVLPAALAAVWVLNVLRVVGLVELGTHISSGLAERGFHSKAGWVLFSLVAVGLLPVMRSPWLRVARARAAAAADVAPVVLYLAPLLVLLATSLVGGLLATRVDWAYGARLITVGAILLWTAGHLKPTLGCSWHALPTGVLVYLLWIALEPAADAVAVAQWRSELSGAGEGASALWIASRVLGSVLVVPLAEELAFRGYLLPRLIDREFTAVSGQRLTLLALLVSSLAFGLLHQRWIAGTLAGVAFALARSWRGRLRDAVVAHATSNALLAADVLLLGRWELWL